MSPRYRSLVVVVAVVGLVVGAYFAWWHFNYRVVEKTDYRDPPNDSELVDDRLEDKNPVFDESLIDRRPLGDWQVNKSAAVIKLDCPAIKPDRQA